LIIKELHIKIQPTIKKEVIGFMDMNSITVVDLKKDKN
jgi:hypothetical protein